MSVREYLWGYKSILYSLKAINENPNCNLGNDDEDEEGEDDFFSSDDDDFGSESEEEKGDPECEIGIGNVKEFGLFMVSERERILTASLSHLRTMLPESSSCPQPAQRPNHAT